MIDFFKENITWIKDFVMLLFAGTGTVITVLTYRRARATLLQPIRSEVIKKQSELLSQVLALCQSRDKIDKHFDYFMITQLNVLLHLRDYGFLFKDHKQIFENLNEQLSGWLYCGESNIIKDVEVISAFSSAKPVEEEHKELIETNRTKYEDAKKGIVLIDKIYLTKIHKEYIEQMHLLTTNPFMPASIQNVLNQILLEVNYNLSVFLKETMVCFIKDYFKRGSENNNYPMFNESGVYNEFNHKRNNHKQTIEKLLKETRNYLRIEEPWEK